MRKGIITLALLLAVISVNAAEINLTEIASQVGFFDAKAGTVTSKDNSQLVMFGFVGGGGAVLLLAIAFIGIIFYKYKYSSKEGAAIKEQDLFNKYNY